MSAHELGTFCLNCRFWRIGLPHGFGYCATGSVLEAHFVQEDILLDTTWPGMLADELVQNRVRDRLEVMFDSREFHRARRRA